MSEVSGNTYEPYASGDGGEDEPINDALAAFTGCVAEALPDICSVGLTIGDSYVPFRPDEDDGCEDDDEMCSQAWVRVVAVTPQGGQSWEGDCAVELRFDLEVGVLRCFEIEKDGEAPSATDMMAAAFQSMNDMKAIHCSALACGGDNGIWSSLESGQWSPVGPLGGQYGGIWTFTATL